MYIEGMYLIIGASLGSFRNISLNKAIKIYSQLSDSLNLTSIEIRFEKEPRRPSSWYWEDLSDISRQLKNYEIKGAHLPFLYLNPISPNTRIKLESNHQIKAAISKAADMGMDYVVMHARGTAYGLTYQEQFSQWIEQIILLAEHAESESILLTLENADFFHNLKGLTDAVKVINSKHLKITLDMGHAYIKPITTPQMSPFLSITLRIIDAVSPTLLRYKASFHEYKSLDNYFTLEHRLIANVHLHDYNGYSDHLSLGRGKIDFSCLRQLEKNCCYKGPYTFEVNLNDHIADFESNYIYLQNLVK